MSAVSYRTALETDSNPRSVAICNGISSWVAGLELESELEEIEREILNASHGRLDEHMISNGYWCGECAAVFCWALLMGEFPQFGQVADHEDVAFKLKIMDPAAGCLFETASLRSAEEVALAAKGVTTIRGALVEMSILDQKDELGEDGVKVALEWRRRKTIDVLMRFGIPVSDSDVARAEETVKGHASKHRNSMRGCYLVREAATTWLLDNRSGFFAFDEE